MQSVTIDNQPFLDLTSTSFTFELWMYANSLRVGSSTADNALVGQYEQKTKDRLLHIVVRNQYAYIGFYSDDLSSNQVRLAFQRAFILTNCLLVSDIEHKSMVSFSRHRCNYENIAFGYHDSFLELCLRLPVAYTDDIHRRFF